MINQQQEQHRKKKKKASSSSSSYSIQQQQQHHIHARQEVQDLMGEVQVQDQDDKVPLPARWTAATPRAALETKQVVVPVQHDDGGVGNAVLAVLQRATRLIHDIGLATARCLLPYLLILLSLSVVHTLLSSFLHSVLLRFLVAPLRSFMNSVFSSSPSPSSLLALPEEALGILSAWYCASVGIGCVVRNTAARDLRLAHVTAEDGKLTRRLFFVTALVHTGNAARIVTLQSERTLDIFESVLALGANDATGLELNHVALWELGIYIASGSNIQDAEFMGKQLEELGYLTRDIRDATFSINSLSLNSFTWILHSFERINRVITRAHVDPSSSAPNLELLLDQFFQQISNDLGAILEQLNKVIPLADSASISGGRLMRELEKERFRIGSTEEMQRSPSFMKFILGEAAEDFKTKQLRRDLDLSSKSVNEIKYLRHGFEKVRAELMQFRDHVGLFKAGMVGSHLASSNLISAEEEVEAMKKMMSNFEITLTMAKGRSKMGSSTDGTKKGGELLELDEKK